MFQGSESSDEDMEPEHSKNNEQNDRQLLGLVNEKINVWVLILYF